MMDITLFPRVMSLGCLVICISDYLRGIWFLSDYLLLAMGLFYPALVIIGRFIPQKVDERFKDAETLEDIRRILQEEKDQTPNGSETE